MDETNDEGTAPAALTRAPRRAWYLVVALTMLNVLGMGIIFPVLPFLTLRYVSPTSLALWVGVLESVNAFCSFLVAPFLGGLSDRIGRRPILILGAFGAAIGYVLFGIGGALWVLVVGRIIQGLTAGDMPALFAYVADITPAPDRAKRYGMLGALSGIGFMAGPAVGGLLARISLNAPIFATAAVAVLVGVISLVLLPESLAPENRASKLKLAELHPLRVMRDAFSRKELRGLLIGLTLITIPFTFYVSNVSVLALDSVGWGPTQVGLMVSGVGVVDIIVQGGLLGILLPRIGERGVVLCGISVQAIGCLGLALCASVFQLPWLLVAACLLLAAGEGGMNAALNGLMSTSVGPEEQGWLAGGVSSIGSAIQMVGPLLAGWMYAVVGHSIPYWTGLVMILAAGLVFVRIRPRREPVPS
jgi:DHA1 family tetracycline resistance protein-like MFS transporter